MGIKSLAICDQDNGYLTMLQAYLQKKKPADFEILVFDTVKQAIDASCDEAFAIFLVGEKLYDSTVAKVKASKVFVLQEDGERGITGYSLIAKYQSMESLIAQVLDGYASDDNCDSASKCSGTKANLISFYAPDRNKGQSFAALGAAQVLAGMGQKVLYLNLLPFTGFEELLRTTYNSDITDFMYFVLNRSDKLLYKLDSMKRTLHGVEYLPPALDYTDLLQISQKDWKHILDILLYSGDYTDILVDLSETCQGFYHILERSDQSYILSDQKSNSSQAMFVHFKNLLKAKEYDAILNHCVEFTLPKGWEQQCDGLGSMAISTMGAYMKGVIDIRN